MSSNKQFNSMFYARVIGRYKT